MTNSDSKAMIEFLQGHFDGRSKLEKAKNALKCYANAKEASIFFSYKDNWGNKQYVNLPVEPEDILPIIQQYIDNIDRSIIKELERSDI